ncbi:PREDICTED: F-box/kelch-repeat protein At5g49000-like [Camelina sativa]|uniref:F-box/kelch-repeat protein At5g49000-like n=1 Tax=Camelina sativa TaxID=90675 RepID=A0ABM1RED4_CAMSA|nr:PREDICTED: F-box/kelch-repeat protein At5g49000-like [Camelina sativa]
MGCTEECVYVFIDSPIEPNPRWFILSVNKNRNRLIPIPSFPTPRSATLVSLGCGIYVIGGLIDCMETALVSYLDCRTHTWSYLPSMNAARAGARAGVLDGKIYVFGGCVEDPSIWAEVFDPKLQTWTRDVIPEDLMKATELRKVVQGQETVTVSCNFPRVQGLWNDFNYCATDRLLYCMHADGSIMWCDPLSGVRQGAMVWRHVYGLNALKPNNRNRLIPIPSFPTPRSATLVSLGCGIYVIGGFKKCLKTALVSYLDCRTHTWSYLPSMSVARAEARAGVLDGKIYVFGGCVEDPSIWAEVFDPKLQTWSRVVIPEDLMKATEVSKVVQGEETITVSCNFPRDKVCGMILIFVQQIDCYTVLMPTGL